MAVITSQDPISEVSQEPRKSAQDRYEALRVDRKTFEDRARQAANLTIPSLGPPESKHSKHRELIDPFQSVGSRGVNNLAAKLLLALLPPGSAFFKLTIDDFVLNELAKTVPIEGNDPRGAFEEALGTVERAITNRIEQINVRATLFEALKQLLVSGNGLLYMLPTRGNKAGGMRLFRIHEYVVKRDPLGRVLEIITEQMLSPTALPQRIRDMILRGSDTESPRDKSVEESIGLYTRISRNGNHWKVHQEVNGEVVPKSEGSFPIDKLPWIPLRFTRIDNEDYGRGYVEEYMGDLRSLDSLSQSVVEGSAAAAKVLIFVNEGGVTTREDVADSPSGSVIDGQASDVTAFQLDKFADFRVARETAEEIKQNLKEAFLLFSSVARDAERVTAEEVRLLASELEDALGGVYSILTQELQLPLVTIVMNQLVREKRLPALPKDVVNPQIITGLEALGRGQDLRKMDSLMQGISTFVGPEAVAEHIDVSAFIKRRGTALGIDLDGLVRTAEDVERRRLQRQQAALAEKLGPEGLRQTGAIARDELNRKSQGE